MCSRWVLAVFGEMTSSAAISLFDMPRARRRRTSTSRSVRPAGPSRFFVVGGGGGEDGGRGVGVDAPGADVVAQLHSRPVGAHRGAVGARFEARLVAVGGGE